MDRDKVSLGLLVKGRDEGVKRKLMTLVSVAVDMIS